MLYVNLVSEGHALLERDPQGDCSIVITLSAEQEAVLSQMIETAEGSAALARLFLAGAVVCEAADEVFPCSTISTR